jgi:hypothetical protein
MPPLLQGIRPLRPEGARSDVAAGLSGTSVVKGGLPVSRFKSLPRF